MAHSIIADVEHKGMTLRAHLDLQLDLARSEIMEMGNLALEMIQRATEAVANRDAVSTKRVIAMDDRVDELEAALIQKVCLLVLQNQPVGSDFRFLTSAMGIIGEVEKVADESVKLCKRYLKLNVGLPSELRPALIEMSSHARQAFGASLRLFLEYSPATLEEVHRAEESIDLEFKEVRRRVFGMIRNNPEASEDLLRVIELFHALEHVGDHAAEIASRLQMHYEPAAANSGLS